MNTLTLPEAFLRSAIGLDRFSNFAQSGQTSNYPPHNIEQIDDDRYVLTLAIAGFSKDEIEVTVHKGILRVAGAKKDEDHIPSFAAAYQKPPTFLYRGISFRDFDRTFQLAEYIRVSDISLENGLLVINLERQVPEEAKPRRLTIG